jgi:thiol-disulfide isomerase/thioredoxin
MRPILFLLKVLLGLAFLTSAYAKFIAPGYFEITLIDQNVVSSRFWAAHITRFFIGIEWAIGMFFLTPFLTKKIAGLSTVLLVGFTGHLIYLITIGNTENCGCLGEMLPMTPVQSIFKNILMLIVSVGLYLNTNSKGNVLWSICIGIILVGSTWYFLPISKHELLSFKNFTHFEKLGRVDINSGEKIIAVFNLDCEHCQEAASQMAKLQKTFKEFPQTFVLYYKEGASTVESFEKKTGFSAPYTFIDTNMFFDLIGNSPPRLYYLKNGKTVHVWDDNFVTNIKKQMDSR